MRYALIASVLCVCGAVHGADTANNAPSVLNHGHSAVTTPATAPEITTSAAATCANGTCCTEKSCRSSCRQGLFGRTVERTREVTRAVVAVPVQAAGVPVRTIRARCCR